MYPQWVEEICRTPCQCHGVPTIDSIIAIGISRPGKGAEFRGPMAMVMVARPDCGQLMSITVREPLKAVIAAMRELVAVLDDLARKMPPPINLPSPKPRASNDSGPISKTGETRGSLRPSLREDQPNTPPTQREIQAFLHRLRRTPFRPRSKGFRNWMKEMGADPDAAGGNAADDDQQTR